ncbi:chromosome segregation protein SMC [Aliigemmobacter aestuarii]|uniref:Chromosome segregation protein SMC n=1 Tax=Aliigemmobacter aestuarii TaxID=1445661 RepID=A0A4S3MQG5_9RHOB|nr:ATP-binding protein [Gemmobacter aestuarii]THD84324.1 chromosome segregation protein SMC [Gemmobacter aestuarii]
MRLRAIELTNVRRFAGKRARLSGIGDGITVLSEPNEFGKSTFFDAIHAVFFERHGSRNAAIKALQPHAGGAPEVAVEVDLPEGRFRIAKRWLAKPQAQVLDATGRLIAQADEAEAWIDRLIGGGLAGPSGLLWVRQGQMGLESDDRRERERDLSARRDLMSSVAGEIDMMTGGRRMDAVIDRVAEALAKLATDSGRPKAGGEWKRAVDEAATLAAEEAVLRPRAERLSGDLARRTEVNRTLARLTDPADAATRAQALTDAQAAHQAALAHQAEVVQAETALRLARLDADRAQQEITAAETLATRVAVAQTALAKAEGAATAARTRADDLGQRDRAATEAAEALARQTRDLRTRLQAATRAETAQAAKAQAVDLQRRLDRATGLRTTLDQTRAQRARITVTARMIEAADKAQSALDLARARAAAQAVMVEARPDGAPAILNGAVLPGGPVPILAAADLTLPGFGTLRIDPGAGHSSDAVTQAEQALSRLLAEAQVESLPAARHQWAEGQRLEAEAKQAAALLAEIAPEGLDTLRTALARAETLAADAPEMAEDAASVTAALAEAEAGEQAARAAAKAAHDVSVQAGEARAAAEANRASAERQLAAALSEAGDPAALGLRIAEMTARAPALSEAATKAETALAALRATAPDLATAEARLTRAKGAVDQARMAEQKAREDLASLNATILALAEEGIEERLATLAGDRAEAEARAARYEGEVRALTRLRRALEEARTKARDAYFGPVLRELQPLLSILHPGAQLTIDDASLLPATLTRNGQPEALDILSGGTREQVAILTRLAFARLFAAAGRPVPVILDDALVHSDDDRIEAMFDALHRTARDQQILVLTCRQRAFAALGGERGEVTVEDV